MIGFLSLIPNSLKFAAGAALAVVAAWYAGNWNGARVEASAAEARAVKAALERIQELEKNNAEFKTLDARGRCLVFARDSGLQDDICD